MIHHKDANPHEEGNALVRSWKLVSFFHKIGQAGWRTWDLFEVREFEFWCWECLIPMMKCHSKCAIHFESELYGALLVSCLCGRCTQIWIKIFKNEKISFLWAPPKLISFETFLAFSVKTDHLINRMHFLSLSFDRGLFKFDLFFVASCFLLIEFTRIVNEWLFGCFSFLS